MRELNLSYKYKVMPDYMHTVCFDNKGKHLLYIYKSYVVCRFEITVKMFKVLKEEHTTTITTFFFRKRNDTDMYNLVYVCIINWLISC